MLPLAPGHVHVWVVFDDDVRDESLLRAYRRLLTDDERGREGRFHFPRHQRQYLVTRALIRVVLSRYSDVAPEDWRFTTNPYGRPAVLEADGARDAVAFNLSHTDGLVLCGVTRTPAIGVDAEHVGRRVAPLEIARRFFSPEEAAALDVVAPLLQSERFFHYWTLKESYIKARGEGLSIPLDRFGFDFPDARRVRIWVRPECNDPRANWRFWLFRPSPEHVAALCVERAERQPLMIRRIVPLAAEEAMELDILRQSE